MEPDFHSDRVRMRRSDAEAFPAAAFAGDVGIAKAKCFVKALFDEIDLGAVDQLQALLVYDHLYALVVKDHVVLVQLIGIIDNVGEAITSGRSDANTQANAATSVFEVIADALRS